FEATKIINIHFFCKKVTDDGACVRTCGQSSRPIGSVKLTFFSAQSCHSPLHVQLPPSPLQYPRTRKSLPSLRVKHKFHTLCASSGTIIGIISGASTTLGMWRGGVGVLRAPACMIIIGVSRRCVMWPRRGTLML
ncbi:unnamed protein product, partial [Nesidiocoris tenuis]